MVLANNHLRRIGIFGAVAWMLAAILPGCGPSYGEEVCTGLTAIANDAKKMAHVKEWIALRLGDKGFRESIRKSHTLHRNDSRLLDLEIGFWPDSVEFNMPVNASAQWDTDQIYSVSVRRGRSSIIFRVGASENLQLDWPPEDPPKLRAVDEDVFVFCEHENPSTHAD